MTEDNPKSGHFALKNKELWLYTILTVLFALLYSSFLFTPDNQMLGIPITDGFQSLAIAHKGVELIQTGHLPAGVFWLHDFYGGSTATYFYVSVIPDISQSFLFFLSALTSNLVLSFKIVSFVVILISTFTSYKLAKFYFKNTGIAWIVSIAYSFSTFYVSQINDGHITFVMAAALLPGVLLLFEKMFEDPNQKNMVLSAASLVLLLLSDLQVTAFSIYYIALRIIYHFALSPQKDRVLAISKRLLQVGALFLLAVGPFLISFSLLQNVGALVVKQNPMVISPASTYDYIARGVKSYVEHGATFYVGITLIAFSLLPILLSRYQTRLTRRNYLFHVLTLTFFFFIAIGTPLSSLATSLFIRVPSRAQILVDFSVCICAGFGLLCLKDFVISKAKILVTKRRVIRMLLVVGVAGIVFIDLTFGMSPTTSPIKLTGGDRFIQNQPGDFRVLKYPIVWGYTNYESALINHEIVGESIMALRSYPLGSELFTILGDNFTDIPNYNFTGNPGLRESNASRLTLFATLCGVKYVLIETNASQTSDYTNFLGNESQYFRVAFSDQDSVVYENRYFKGTAFAVKDEGRVPNATDVTLQELTGLILADAQVTYSKGFNTIDVSVNASEAAYVVISQSYSPYWTLKGSGSGSPAFTQFLNVSAIHVNQGTYKETAVFSAADQTWKLYAVFFVPLTLASLALYANFKGKKGLLRLSLLSLFGFGFLLLLLAFLGTSLAPASMTGLAGFGVFNGVILGLGGGVSLASLIALFRRRFFGFVWSLLAKTRKAAGKAMGVACGGWSRRLFAGVVVGLVILFVSAAFLTAGNSQVFKAQPEFDGTDISREQVLVGNQITFSLGGRALLSAVLAFFIAGFFFAARRFLSELRRTTLRATFVELLSLFGAIVGMFFEVYRGGSFFALNLFTGEALWLWLAIGLALFFAVLHFLRAPKILCSLDDLKDKIIINRRLMETLIAIMATSMLTLAILLNINLLSVSRGGPDWIDPAVWGTVSVALSLYLVKTVFTGLENQNLPRTVADSGIAESSGVSERRSGIDHMHLGIFGGLIGVAAAGFLMRETTSQYQDFVSSALVLCGALGGLGFGALVTGNGRKRGLIGCVFGVLAIFFGLVMTYSTPIVVGYSMSFSTGTATPVYLWHEYGFFRFIEIKLSTLPGIFFSFLGLVAAYLAGAHFSIYEKLRKRLLHCGAT
jgi:hypothetical protein